MMDTAISGTISPAGNASSSSSSVNPGKGEKGEKSGGFQTALSSVKNSNQKQDDDKAAADTAADQADLLNSEATEAAAAAEQNGELRNSRFGRPGSVLIDLQQTKAADLTLDADAAKAAALLARKPVTGAKIEISSLKKSASDDKAVPAADLEKLKAAVAKGKSEEAASVAATDADVDADTSETPAPSKSADDVLSILNSMTHAKSAKASSANGASADATSPRRSAEKDVAIAGLQQAAATETVLTSGVPGVDGSSEGDSSDSGRTFRFSGARGRSMDMTVSTGTDDKAEFKVGASSNGAAENIAVLDSRRYIGLAPGSNGSSLTSAISGNPEWSSAMQPGSELSNAAAASSTGRVVNTLKLQMHPIDLGAVTATLRLTGDELSVHLTVQTGAAYRQLTEDGNSILDALKAQGFAVDQVTVSLAPVATSDTGNSATGGQGQSAGQQPMQNDNGGGNASANGQQNGAQNAGGDSTRTSDNAASDIGNAAGALGARPNLYL